MKLLKPFISKFDNIFEGYNAYFIITDDDLQTLTIISKPYMDIVLSSLSIAGLRTHSLSLFRSLYHNPKIPNL